ncbi:uncharacterized protein LOC132548760 isoform X2 [Ylistrum balloti]|nr:uncharacterized protein LOC132548760 isoform X2 [Ylistrum balloti]XP_060068626.1 uncharacterized protein LOC132548760 isoform X2 [Ylistrum balloti]XP_060068627.1 uncharacterized protein LOC132548760 isoform X2 [Ylistrum balloti]
MASKYGRSILRQQYPIRTKGNSRCPSHSDNDVILQCQDCNILICVTCSITSHKTHIDSFRELSKIHNEQKSNLQAFVNQTDNEEIPKLKEEIMSSQRKLSTFEQKYKTISESIFKQRDRCKLEIDKITEEYIAICENMEKATSYLLQTHVSNLEEKLEALEKISSECKQTLQTGTAVHVYDSVSEVHEMDLDFPPTPNIDMAEFTLNKDLQSLLKQAMGDMKISPNLVKSGSRNSAQGLVTGPKFSNIGVSGRSSGTVLYRFLESSTVITQLLYQHGITSICPTPDGRAWLCNMHTNTVKLISNKSRPLTKKAKVLQEIQHKSDLTDISLDPTTGRLWFCCGDERTIYEVSSSKPVSKYTIEEFPASLCTTKEGQVVVGTWGTQGYNVLMYTADGRVLHTTTVESSGTGVVQSITQCPVTGNIAVVSSKLFRGDGSDPDNFRRHVIVYNSTLQPLVHYRGEGIQAVTPDKFDPFTVTYDSKGNIVVGDITRNTIELISGLGEYIKTLHTNKRDQGPVGIQNNDVLWSHLMFDSGKWGLKLLKYYND